MHLAIPRSQHLFDSLLTGPLMTAPKAEEINKLMERERELYARKLVEMLSDLRRECTKLVDEATTPARSPTR